MSIHDRIRHIRKHLGMNQGAFARQMGLTQAAQSAIELGESKITEKNIKLICVTFAVNESWLRTGEGEMFGPASPYEKELLETFRELSPGMQEAILDIAKILLQKEEKI